eukprot:1074513-Rhodomonas_salina.2
MFPVSAILARIGTLQLWRGLALTSWIVITVVQWGTVSGAFRAMVSSSSPPPSPLRIVCNHDVSDADRPSLLGDVWT